MEEEVKERENENEDVGMPLLNTIDEADLLALDRRGFEQP
jgi:hypothetical protein